MRQANTEPRHGRRTDGERAPVASRRQTHPTPEGLTISTVTTVPVADPRRLVDELWAYCNLLRDDGVSTIEYVEQLTYLLFLKMADERANRALDPETIVPDACSWQRLLDKDGDAESISTTS